MNSKLLIAERGASETLGGPWSPSQGWACVFLCSGASECRKESARLEILGLEDRPPRVLPGGISEQWVVPLVGPSFSVISSWGVIHRRHVCPGSVCMCWPRSHDRDSRKSREHVCSVRPCGNPTHFSVCTDPFRPPELSPGA